MYRYLLLVQTLFLIQHTPLSVCFLFAKYLLFYLSASASACFVDFSAASLSKLVFIPEYALILSSDIEKERLREKEMQVIET